MGCPSKPSRFAVVGNVVGLFLEFASIICFVEVGEEIER